MRFSFIKLKYYNSTSLNTFISYLPLASFTQTLGFWGITRPIRLVDPKHSNESSCSTIESNRSASGRQDSSFYRQIFDKEKSVESPRAKAVF